MNSRKANPTPYTPGPWSLGYHGHIYGATGLTLVASIVVKCYDDRGAQSAEEAANGRLIAAAPELHDLARAARDYLSGIPETAAGGDDAAVALTRRLDAVLARIGGAA